MRYSSKIYQACIEKWENNGWADGELAKCHLEKMCRWVLKDKLGVFQEDEEETSLQPRGRE